jgi:hypothetical protein
MTNCSIDNSQKFIICAFDNNTMGVFDLQCQIIKLIAPIQGTSFNNVHIDELSSMVGCLDLNGTFIHLLILEWKYTFDEPTGKNHLKRLGNKNRSKKELEE